MSSVPVRQAKNKNLRISESHEINPIQIFLQMSVNR